MPRWHKISSLYLMSVPNYWTLTKNTQSNPYKIEIMIIYLIKMLELTKVTWSHLQYNLSQVPIFFWWRHEQKYDAITFTSQYFYFKKVQNPLKTRKTLKELCNKRQSISVFSNTAKVVNFRWKNADAGRFEINIAWILHTRTFIFASHLFFSVPFDLI